MADDEQVETLVNGDALHNGDGLDNHEMEDITSHHISSPGKQGIELETGMTNGGYEGENEAEDEETRLVSNEEDTEHKPTVDSGVEIDGTDSDPNSDQPQIPPMTNDTDSDLDSDQAQQIPPMTNGIVDDEDGLYESFSGVINGLDLSLTESELTTMTDRASIALTVDEPEVETSMTLPDPMETSTAEDTVPSDDVVVNKTEEADESSNSNQSTVEHDDVSTPQEPEALYASVQKSPRAVTMVTTSAEDLEAGAEEATAEQNDVSTSQDPEALYASVQKSPSPVTMITGAEEASADSPLETEATAAVPEVETSEDKSAASCPLSACKEDDDTGERDVSVCPYANIAKSSASPDPDDTTVVDAPPEAPAPNIVLSSPDYAVLDFPELPWPAPPGDDSAEPGADKEGHFVYVSTLDPGSSGFNTARSAESDWNSVDMMEIPYERLTDDAESDEALETDSSLGESIELSSLRGEPENRPNTSTPTAQLADPDLPAASEAETELGLIATTEWPEPPTPITPLGTDSIDGPSVKKDPLTRTKSDPNPEGRWSPTKPLRSYNSLQYNKPIMAYEIEIEDECDGDQEEIATSEGNPASQTSELSVSFVEVHENEMPLEEEGAIPPGPADSDAATEYENAGNTIKNYEEDGEGDKELETPEYTPPPSPKQDPNHDKYTTIDIDLQGEGDDKIRFIQHEGEDDATTRAQSRAKFKRKTDWKCICLSLLCFVVLLLAAAFAFFVAMFLTGGLDHVLNEDDALISLPPQLPKGDTIRAPPIDKITTIVQLRLDRMWNVLLDAPSSPERQLLDRIFTEAMDETFRWSLSVTKFVYEETIIEEFRPDKASSSGIYARFMCSFYDVPNGILPADPSQTPSTDDLYQQAMTYMSDLVFETLSASLDNGYLDDIGAQRGTIEILRTDVTRG